MNLEGPDPLDSLLAQWRMEDPVPPGFQSEVWQRIDADRRRHSWMEDLLSWWLAPRRMALSALFAVSAGALLGYFEVDYRYHQARRTYFSLINPMDRHHPESHQFTNP